MTKRKTKSEKKDDDESQCFDLKQMMQKKLDELADIRGRIEGKVVQTGREGLRESLQGTATGNAIVVLDTAEKEYNRIKKLYEQCMIDCGCSTLQGTIAENSLAQTDILSKVLVEKTYMVNQSKIHDVIVKEKLLPELAQAMTDGPGYMHFWREGGDDVKVVFKNKSFDIKRSDASTWAKAESYGESLRKGKNQLDLK